MLYQNAIKVIQIKGKQLKILEIAQLNFIEKVDGRAAALIYK